MVAALSQAGKTLALPLIHRVTLGKSSLFSRPQSPHIFRKIVRSDVLRKSYKYLNYGISSGIRYSKTFINKRGLFCLDCKRCYSV